MAAGAVSLAAEEAAGAFVRAEDSMAGELETEEESARATASGIAKALPMNSGCPILRMG